MKEDGDKLSLKFTLGLAANTLSKQSERTSKVLSGMALSNMAAMSTSSISASILGVSEVMEQFQNKLGKQFKGIDFGMISALSTYSTNTSSISASILGVSEVMEQLQNKLGKQFKGIDFSMISALSTYSTNTSSIMASIQGISGMMEQFQNKLGKQFKGIDFSMISALSTATLGINGMMAQFQDKLGDQLKGIDLSNVKINENGTVDYLDETINIKDAIEDVSSYFLENMESEQEVEQSAKSVTKIKSIINILMFIFMFVLIINTQPQLVSTSLEKTPIKQQIAENIGKLSGNVESGLDEMVKFFLFIFAFGNKVNGEINAFAIANPASFIFRYEAIKYILKRIYNTLKKQRESSNYPDEILNDRKRIIKLIKSQLKVSIEKHFNSEIINKIYQGNFGLVNKKSLDVRTSNNFKSQIIYKLILGEVVIIIGKNREWTEIQFVGKDNCDYGGWVSTKYIHRVD
ncbi:SH3 domain-containing protein [Clostridium estertheticum]|uniref:SH3 domain-containing protein n=1 Tax=Clostridium estertheticum TaxID=238834 RepID=UPI0013E91043|nr:SH3 domain-containing protein [Clostridium estertheticum]MBZ9684976.1 SH3 domain-containing protein [Clostridium estertheticum]